MATDKKTDCFEAMKRDILSLELPPGSSLDETQLSQQYQISRTPLRDILQRLDGLGFVTHERNRGAIVTPRAHITGGGSWRASSERWYRSQTRPA